MQVLANQITSRNRGTKASGGAKPRERKSHCRLVVIHSIDPTVVVKRWDKVQRAKQSEVRTLKLRRAKSNNNNNNWQEQGVNRGEWTEHVPVP